MKELFVHDDSICNCPILFSFFGKTIKDLFSSVTRLSIFGAEFEFNAEIRQRLQKAILSYPTKEDFYVSEDALTKILEEAKRARNDLQGSRILWVDQHTVANANIFRFLNDLGINIDTVTSNEQVENAMKWSPNAYEVIVTNMKHLEKNLSTSIDEKAGEKLIKYINNSNIEKKVILFIASKPDEQKSGFD
ncbi:MAG: hypothetical protein WBC91_16570, partial [Phototrophicaceae bacterium]